MYKDMIVPTTIDIESIMLHTFESLKVPGSVVGPCIEGVVVAPSRLYVQPDVVAAAKCHDIAIILYAYAPPPTFSPLTARLQYWESRSHTEKLHE